MKRTRQDLESELRSFRPQSPSDRVLNRIAGQLGPTPRTKRWANVWTWGAAAVALAAGIAIALLWWPQPSEVPGPSPSLPVVDRDTLGPPELPAPTMLAYQRVLGQSADELNELLDRQATSFLAASSPSDDIGSLYQDLMPN